MPAHEPTDGSAVSQRLLQLVDQRRRGTDSRTDQLAFFRESEVEGDLCSRKTNWDQTRAKSSSQQRQRTSNSSDTRLPPLSLHL